MRHLGWLAACLVALAMFSGSQPLAADETPGNFEVHDLSLWILDPGDTLANARGKYGSALPASVASGRSGNTSQPVPIRGAARRMINVNGNFIVAESAPTSTSSGPQPRRVAPIGLVRFFGAGANELDVDLRTKAGSFLAHWPAGEIVPNRLRWSSSMPAMMLSEKLDGDSELAFVDDEHWIAKARGGSSLYVRRGARAERFLAYDAELTLPAPIRLEGSGDKFKVINLTNAPLYDVLVSRATPEGRRVAWIDVLPKSESAKPAVTPNKPGPAGKKPAEQLFDDAKPAAPAGNDPKDDSKPKDDVKPAADAKPAEGKPNAFVPAAAPAVAGAPAAAPVAAPAAIGLTPAATPATPNPVVKGLFGGLGKLVGSAAKPAQLELKGVDITLGEPVPQDNPEAMQKLKQELSQRLARAGLKDEEVELFVSQYSSLFFENEAVVAACRLDQNALEEKLPLSVFPQPTKVVRVGLVVVRNADPQLGNEVDQLVKQLGDPAFAVREAAQARLTELGPLAFAALNKAINHADLEIAIRAERILLNQNQTPGQTGQAAGGKGNVVNGVINLNVN